MNTLLSASEIEILSSNRADSKYVASAFRYLLQVWHAGSDITDSRSREALCSLFMITRLFGEELSGGLLVCYAVENPNVKLSAALWNRMRQLGLCSQPQLPESVRLRFNEAVRLIPVSNDFFNVENIEQGDRLLTDMLAE